MSRTDEFAGAGSDCVLGELGKGWQGTDNGHGLPFFLLFCKNENFLNLMAAQLGKKSF